MAIRNKISNICISFAILSSLLITDVEAKVQLDDNNWNPKTKEKLEKLLNDPENINKNKKIVFDLDDTILSGGIGSVVYGHLIQNNMIKKENLKCISPSFTLDGEEVSIETTSITKYYDKLYAITKDYKKTDPTNAYAWNTQSLNGLTVADIVNATKDVFQENIASQDRKNNTVTKFVVDGQNYTVPFFHPETVDLIGNLLTNGYNVHVVSGSSIWSIRYLISVELKRLLEKKFGKGIEIKPENLYGMSTLIKDKRDGKVFIDALLVKEKTKRAELYKNLDMNEISNYEITPFLTHPISGYEGKTAVILKYIVDDSINELFMAAGDSPNDHSMLSFAQNKLLFPRLDRPEYIQVAFEKFKENKNNWFIQPTISKAPRGFIKDENQIKSFLKDEKLKKALEVYNTFKNEWKSF